MNQKEADAIYLICIGLETVTGVQMIHDEDNGQMVLYMGITRDKDDDKGGVIPWEDK